MLFLTPHESLPDVVEELDIGTADYVTRPIRIAEVLARVKVLLRDRGTGRESAGRADPLSKSARSNTRGYRHAVADAGGKDGAG